MIFYITVLKTSRVLKLEISFNFFFPFFCTTLSQPHKRAGERLRTKLLQCTEITEKKLCNTQLTQQTMRCGFLYDDYENIYENVISKKRE